MAGRKARKRDMKGKEKEREKDNEEKLGGRTVADPGIRRRPALS